MQAVLTTLNPAGPWWKNTTIQLAAAGETYPIPCLILRRPLWGFRVSDVEACYGGPESWYNVIADGGVNPNDTRDDTAALQAALNAVFGAGKIHSFPAQERE